MQEREIDGTGFVELLTGKIAKEILKENLVTIFK